MGFAHYGGKLPPWFSIFSTKNSIITKLKYVSKFIMCFIRFWMKLDKFIMVKVANSLINEIQLLYKKVNSLIINGIHQ
jgi:hypothetical protein